MKLTIKWGGASGAVLGALALVEHRGHVFTAAGELRLSEHGLEYHLPSAIGGSVPLIVQPGQSITLTVTNDKEQS